MKQENVKKLLSLLSNYVIEASKIDSLENVTDDIARYLNLAANAATTPLTLDEKGEMYYSTVHALNCGSPEANEEAFCIRLRALASGDDELIDKIEYLHQVI